MPEQMPKSANLDRIKWPKTTTQTTTTSFCRDTMNKDDAAYNNSDNEDDAAYNNSDNEDDEAYNNSDNEDDEAYNNSDNEDDKTNVDGRVGKKTSKHDRPYVPIEKGLMETIQSKCSQYNNKVMMASGGGGNAGASARWVSLVTEAAGGDG